ncbi:MAG: class II aldolase/adducin family protein [Clostridia bacterium]|nr:class II aldolase/adducin family protein [Clostridia bacterium]
MQFGYLHPADQLLMIMQRIYSRGMTTTSGGNLSIMDDDGNIWITPASIDKGTLTRKDIVCVKPNGEVVGIHKPSSELPFHASVYRRRPDLKAVLHAHPPALVAFSIVRKLPKMDLMPSTGKLLGKVAISEYAVPGSEQLGQNIAIFFDQGYDIVFLENHGVCIGGKSIFEAFQKFETLEYTASLEIAAKSLGETVSLSAEDIAATETACEMEEFENAVTPEELAVRRDMIPFIHRSYNQNLINATSGSFSVKLSDGSFVITPFGKDRAYLEECDLVHVKDGKREAGKVPSRAVAFHAAMYAEHPEANAVILASPQNVMAFAVTHTVFDPRTIPESYLLLRDAKMVDHKLLYEDPTAAAKLYCNPVPALIFKNDSIAVQGETLLKAFDRLEVAEATAHSIVKSRALGDIVHISDEAIDEIKVAFNLAD